SIQSFLFTDRSIYRPGQIVYFKGIRVSRDGSGKSSIVPNTKTLLSLVDANGQKIDSLELTSNEFGSYSGKFNLPSNSLNGMFYIQDA
ncbi:MG2 domain-containing protein, partial [Salmonella enterica subsp. enterica serovar Typhimurium]|nr:MG2 domain-containing protein [Salmonella enterica subsp. enterica serovar Typhimurium]